MTLETEFYELQRLLAQTDLITEPLRKTSSGFVEALLAKRKPLKIKIYQETGMLCLMYISITIKFTT
jgi:hypothetical protein